MIYITRHGEREDVVDTHWLSSAHRSDDDPPLAEKGRIQAKELGQRLLNEKIDHIICSPFERCVETAFIVSNMRLEHLPINLEPGICEVLYDYPPGYLSVPELKKLYPLVNEHYQPLLIPDKWEAYSVQCIERVTSAAKKIREHFNGNILVVSHGACISAMLQLWTSYEKKVGVCTLTKLQPDKRGDCLVYKPILVACDKHITDKSNMRAFW